MRERQLGARRRKAYRVTTKSNHSHPVAENLLQRQFSVSAANRVWVSDITYIATAEGWMYLCVVLDLYSRRVVGWSMGRSLGVGVGGERLADGRAASPTASGPGVALRPRGAVLRARVSSPFEGAQDTAEHEPQGRLLGQRVRRDVLCEPEDGVDREIGSSSPGSRRGGRSSSTSRCSTTVGGCIRTWDTSRRTSSRAHLRTEKRHDEGQRGGGRKKRTLVAGRRSDFPRRGWYLDTPRKMGAIR